MAESNGKNRTFTITKKVAKHGTQSIIVIPRILEQHLKPGTLTQISIEVLDNFEKIGGGNDGS